MYARYEELLKEKGVTNYKVAKDTGIAQATLSDWKNGKSTPKNDKLQILADYFDVSLDYLVGNSDFRSLRDEYELSLDVQRSEDFSRRDKRDIAKTMNFMLEQLDNYQEALMFDGEDLDDDTRELLKDSLINSLKMGKLIAKQKYTPNKYKK
jgi:transcriptional regulator with XRE-family HTH domain